MNDSVETPETSTDASEACALPTSAPKQVDLYDDLRRIGELEDQKKAIQSEIDGKTERLREALGDIDPDSLLFQVLTAALATTKSSQATKTARKPTVRKKAKAKTSRRKS